MKSRELPKSQLPLAVLASALALSMASSRGWAAVPAESTRAQGLFAGSATLVINEVDYVEPLSPLGGPNDQAEFVELLNVADHAISLGEYVLVGINRRGGSYRRYPLPAQDLAPGGYFVVCGKADRVPNCDLTVSPDTNTWEDQRNQGPAAIGLVKNASGLPADDELVDAVSYNGNTPGGPQRGGTWTETAGVAPGDPGTDAGFGISRVPDGADTDHNNDDFSVRCLTPGHANPSDPPGPNGCPSPAEVLSLVVNEIDVSQPITDDAEFVEIMNISPHRQSLAHKVLAAVDVQGSVYHRDELPAVDLDAGEHFLVCTNNGKVAGCDYVIPNSGIDYWHGSGTRASAVNAIALMRAPTGKQDGDILIDTLSYGGNVPGDVPTGGKWYEESGKSPGDPANAANLGLSRSPDGHDFNVNQNDFAITCISPGYANTGNVTPTGCGQPATRTPSPAPTKTATATFTPLPSPTITEQPTKTTPPTDTPTDMPTKTPAPTDTPQTGPTPTSPTQLTGFRVDDAGNDADGQPGDGFCRTGRGTCTLRAAIQELNATAAGARFELRFALRGAIPVPPLDPLPALRRGNVWINGMSARPSVAVALAGDGPISPPASGRTVPAIHVPTSLLPSVDVPDQLLPAIRLQGPVDGSATHGLVLDGASNVTVQGLEITGFATGIVLAGGAQSNLVGSDGDGSNDAAEANFVHGNLQNGVGIDGTTRGNTLRGNAIYHNNWHGIALARTSAGANTLTENRISDSGGAAIGVAPLGAELAPPVIDEVVPASRSVSGHVARPCLRCKVELFADPVDEARVFLGYADVEAATGKWTLSVASAPATDPGLTASLTDGAGNTSRLSEAEAIGAWWRLVEVPPDHPRALGPGRTLERSYRLLDENGNPQPGAKVIWSPVDKTFITDENGLVRCIVPIDELAGYAAQGLAMSIQAVSRADDSVHPVRWHPRMAVARARRGLLAGDVSLDLSNLGDDGIGGLLQPRRPRMAAAWASTLWSSLLGEVAPAVGNLASSVGRSAAGAPDQADSQSYGAAYTAASVDTLREGEFAWQENIARGGGIYELRAVGETLSGDLEIVAPAAAFNPGQPASACSATPLGATIAGWNDDGICWVPVPGASANSPGQGSSAFTATVRVDVLPGNGLLADNSNYGTRSHSRLLSSPQSLLQASGNYTLYTVGFDNQAPMITPTLANGAVIALLPPVLAVAEDSHAGINAAGGITVTLGGKKLTTVYDPETHEIQVPSANRALPSGLSGNVTLLIEVRDGFCLRSTVSRNVRVPAPPTSTPVPGGGMVIYTPYVSKRAGVAGR